MTSGGPIVKGAMVGSSMGEAACVSVTFCIAEGEVLSMTGLKNPRDLPGFQVLGPIVREGLPEIALFLYVVKDMHR